ncbi:MAG: gamma-glutamyltransferase [Gemmatimonadota bacterium]|nr:MAG: gamma-glutamyltransferase [Gemmatimonadota bacterium]
MAGRSTVFAPQGAAATSQPLASTTALEMLQRGGNAIDAAVAAAVVLNVVEPHMTGMGGDMFAILWSADEQRLTGLDASGRAGSLISPRVLRERGFECMPDTGPEAITVPGALSGWMALLKRYGTLSTAEALAPAIRIAEEGFPVTPIIARQWRAQRDKLSRDPGASATYLIDGEGPEAGEWRTNRDLATTLRTIAREGPGAFYGGDLGRRVVDGLHELGGFLTLEDLKHHEARWVDPISADFRGYTVWELPPAGQGVAALQMLKLLEPLDLEGMGHNSAAYLHHLIETKKLAFADLGRYVADPDSMEVSAEALLDAGYMDTRRALIDPERATQRADPGRAATESETIYLSVADKDGNMVSLINSIFGHFGSGVVVAGTGLVLQNRGAGFTLDDGHANQVAARKRPFHTIIPGFVTKDGAPWMAFGLMGGAMQPQGHVQMLINLMVFGMDLQQSVDAARFRHMNGTRVAFESPIGPEVRAALEAMGHELIDENDVAFGGAQGVIKLERGWAAGSDPRKDGMAVGH